MTRIPKGADLILNKVSGAPGFWIGNVIVMAGVPSIMQAMLDEVAPKLKAGVRILSETVCADLAGEAEWRTTRTTPLAQPTPQELLPCAANQRAWCSRITATASAALSTQHGICISWELASSNPGRNIFALAHSTRPLHIGPAKISGVSWR